MSVILLLSLILAILASGAEDCLHAVMPYSYISANAGLHSLVQTILKPACSKPKSRKPPPVKKERRGMLCNLGCSFLSLCGLSDAETILISSRINGSKKSFPVVAWNSIGAHRDDHHII